MRPYTDTCKTRRVSYFRHTNTPKTRPVLYLNPWRGGFGGVCNTPLHGYMKNWAGFIFPHPDTPKTHPVLYPNPWRETFRGVCFCAPTRVHEKPGGFHISPLEYTKNAPDFTLPNRDAPKTCPILYPSRRRGAFRGVCFCAPTRVRAKPDRFHISARGYVKNAPDFTLPNRDTPKTHPVLDPNLRRGFLGGVCNTPLHGYVQNPSGFIFPHTT